MAFKAPVPDDWKSAWLTLTDYWRLYGGIKAVLRSPYIAVAAVITAVIAQGWKDADKLVQAATQIVPGLLGFSIGAFAIILVFSSERIIKIIAQRGSPESLLMKTCAMFVHFIICQVVALCVALASPTFPIITPVALFFLVYSLLLAIATSFALFNLAQIYNQSMKDANQPDARSKPQRPKDTGSETPP